jgi:hypothetical protein
MFFFSRQYDAARGDGRFMPKKHAIKHNLSSRFFPEHHPAVLAAERPPVLRERENKKGICLSFVPQKTNPFHYL